MRRAAAASAIALLVLTAAAAVPGVGRTPQLPGAPKCPIFPRTSQWNKRVDRLPLHPRSAAIVSAVGRAAGAHADFGSGLIPAGTSPRTPTIPTCRPWGSG